MHMALVYSSYLRVNVAEYGRYEPMITEPMITPKSRWIKGLGCQNLSVFTKTEGDDQALRWGQSGPCMYTTIV